MAALDVVGTPPRRDRIGSAGVPSSGWHAHLTLSFALSRGRTTVAARRHSGPLCIQRAFYPEDGVCHVYVLHPPGGLAGGDSLRLDASAEAGAAVLMTTPASTKFYRSEGLASLQTQSIRVEAGASFEWLPLDAILFGGSRAVLSTDVHITAGGRFIGWEMTSLGRPLSGDAYVTGSFGQRTRIDVDGAPRLIERLRWQVGDPVLTAPWGLAGFGVLGSLYAYPADDALLGAVRALLEPQRTLRAAATRLDDLLVVRALTDSPEVLRDAFELLWSGIRPAVIGRVVSAPRIWRT